MSTENMPELTSENIVPVGSRLLIEPFTVGETKSGLVLGEGDGHATPVYGTVIKVGDNCIFKVGDHLLFRRYAIDSLKTYTADGDKEVYLLEETEVIGVVRGGVEPREKQSNTDQIKEKHNATRTSKEDKDETRKGEDVANEESSAEER